MKMSLISYFQDELLRLGVTEEQLAKEAEISMNQLHTLLNDEIATRNEKELLQKALLRLEVKQARRQHGLSDDLEALIERYQELSPDYAEKLRKIIFQNQGKTV